MQVNINRQKLGLEDLEFGTGIVTQTRNNQQVPVTELNIANIFASAPEIISVLDPLEPGYDNAAVILEPFHEVINHNVDCWLTSIRVYFLIALF